MAFPGLGNAISNSWKCRFQAPKTASVFCILDAAKKFLEPPKKILDAPKMKGEGFCFISPALPDICWCSRTAGHW